MAPIPHGADARALPPCDLVMKGGVTSGIVYPPVAKVLAEHYRFDSIGGTSAGAIAAAVTAAAEYGRQCDNGGGIERLDAAVHDLTTPGLLAGLFQPTPRTRPLFEILLRALPTSDPSDPSEDTAPPPSRASRVWGWVGLGGFAAVRASRERSETRLAAVVLVSALAALVVAAFTAFPAGAAIALTVAALVVAAIVVATMAVVAVGLLLWQTYRALNVSDYGMCPGTKQADRSEVALIDWLDQQIQCCAGRTTAQPPLTFRELREQKITLTMMSTDLSFARPVRLPDGLSGYLFDPAEMRERFPDRVVDAMMTAEALSDARTAARSQWMPTDDLPVLVGVRLSLSFPVLLSAMRLYLPNPVVAGVERHVFSDGGISSNFPVHFFDAWLPGRPTFGIDLARHADDQPDTVFMPTSPTEPLPPRLGEVRSLQGFATNIIDTMQNWRDSLQSELPGFRDRICQIRMSKREGGLSLTMPPPVVKHLIELGEEGGQTILSIFDAQRWDEHRWIRYLTMMSQLQGNLQKAGAPFGTFRLGLANGLPDVPFSVYRVGRGFDWCQSAEEATTDLLALATAWGPAPLSIDFCGTDLPLPVPVMRIVPVA